MAASGAKRGAAIKVTGDQGSTLADRERKPSDQGFGTDIGGEVDLCVSKGIVAACLDAEQIDLRRSLLPGPR